MHTGAQNVYIRNTDWVRSAMQAVKPTVMCAVPRFYEKVFSAINDKVALAKWHQRVLFHWAVGCGERKFKRLQQGRPLPWLSEQMYTLADRLVLRKLRGVLGAGTFSARGWRTVR